MINKSVYLFKTALLLISVFFLFQFLHNNSNVFAQTIEESALNGQFNPDTKFGEIITTPTSKVVEIVNPKNDGLIDPLVKVLNEQYIGSLSFNNVLKYAIRNSINAGVPINTIVLLLLLPAVAAIIAGARHVIGVRGFGIFLPASLSVVFVAIGPILGISIFLIIIFISTFMRVFFRKYKIKLQYLPRMALILLFVVFGVLTVLFMAPVIKSPKILNVSIFPVLILVLLSEEFTRVQLGKNIKIAVNLAVETLLLSLVAYFFMTTSYVQRYILLNPEIYILIVMVIDILMGKYIGLRFVEYWRFRKLISG